MRCPKCGYTSFDHLESCKKCHKSFGPAIEEFNGTTYEAVAPLFLKIARELEETPPPESMEKLDFEEIDFGDELEEEQETNLRQGLDTEFILDEDILAKATNPQESFVNDGEELVVDLDDMEEVAPGMNLPWILIKAPEMMKTPSSPPLISAIWISRTWPPLWKRRS